MLCVDEPYDDELDCECTDEQFQCDFGMCLPRGLYCDGTDDCPDGSDEREDCSESSST